MDDAARRRRAQRRAFIREHHPDAGGDPAAFIAGLTRLDAAEPAGDDRRPVIVRRRRPLLTRLARTLLPRRRRVPRRVR